MPIAAQYFVALVEGELVAHLAVCPRFDVGAFRATRLVVMPEWQGAGVGTRFLNWVAEWHKRGNGRQQRKLPTLFHTSHPQLIGYLKRSNNWVLKSQKLHGESKLAMKRSMTKSSKKKGENKVVNSGFGGHFRAVQGFKYIGDGQSPQKGVPE